jgi:hypothetical protein
MATQFSLVNWFETMPAGSFAGPGAHFGRPRRRVPQAPGRRGGVRGTARAAAVGDGDGLSRPGREQTGPPPGLRRCVSAGSHERSRASPDVRRGSFDTRLGRAAAHDLG